MNYNKIISLALALVVIVITLFTGCGSSSSSADSYPAKGAGRLEKAYVQTEEQTPEPLPKNGVTVCVDPGHGFDDPGTFSDLLGDLCEKDITLAVAEKLKYHLELLGYTVVMTHDGESFPRTSVYDNNNKYKPEERVAYANSLGSTIDYYISIHCNSFETDEASGTRIYYYEGPQKLSGYDIDITQAVADQIGVAFPDDNTPTVEKYHYYVITYTKVPASLVEIGFVTNPDDAADMIDPGWQEKYAKALADGIDNYYKENPLQ